RTYIQVRFIPATEVENYIDCNETGNLDQFPHPNIRSLERFPKWRRRLQKLKGIVWFASPLGSHLPLLAQVFRAVQPDILHSHFGHIGSVNASLAKTYGIKHVVSFYGADVNYIPHMDHRWLERYQELGTTVQEIRCAGPFMA